MPRILGFLAGTAIVRRAQTSAPHTCTQRRHTVMASSAPSSKLKVALCQIAVTACKEDNISTAQYHLRKAAANGANIALLPECWNCPYDTACFAEYAEELPAAPCKFGASTSSASLRMLRSVARDTNMLIIGGSIPEVVDGKYYNTSMSVDGNGNVLAKHRKVHLFDVDVPNGVQFRESDALSAGNSLTAFNAPQIDAVVGVGICYDMRFPELSMIATRNHGASLLVFPGAFNMTTGPAHWELLLRARAVDNQTFVAACSPARDNNGKYVAWGHSSVIDPWGTVIATTDEKPDIVYADIDLRKIDEIRAAIPTSKQRRHDLYELRAV